MNLFEAKQNTECVIKLVKIEEFKTKIRLMELGVFEGVKIMVKKKSVLKKTLLVAFNYSCFTLKDEYAKKIEVEYA